MELAGGQAFEERRQHAFNKLLWHVPEDVRSGRFLDIGCGTANAIIAALQHGSTLAVGVDRNLSEFAHHRIAPFQELCIQYSVEAKRALLIEGDIFDYNFAPDTFDYAMMLDSIEHVPQPAKFIEYAARALRPAGYFVVDTCPLYYSQMGHHLWHWFSEPWVHLRRDFPQRLEAARIDSWSLQRFYELNKVTHDQIRAAMEDAGFEIVEEHRDQPTPEALQAFEREKVYFELDHINNPHLFEAWLLLVGRRK